MLLGLFFLLILVLLVVAFRIDFRIITDGFNLQPHLEVGVGPLSLVIPRRLLAKMAQILQSGGFQSLEQIFARLHTALRIFDSFVQRIDLLRLQVVVGTGDPFLSALSCGGIWALLGPFLTSLSLGHRLQTQPRIVIEPDHGAPTLRLDLHCIFRFRLGQIIVNELKRITS